MDITTRNIDDEWPEVYTSSSGAYQNDNTTPKSSAAEGQTQEDISMAQLQFIVRHLQLYLTPLLVVCGVMFNTVCLVLLSHHSLLRLSTTHYIISILSADLIKLLCVLQTWLNEFTLNLYFIGGWCQFSVFAQNIVTFLSVWSMVGLGMDRFVCLCLPRQELKVCTPCVARVVILGLLVLSVVVYLNTSLLHGVYTIGHRSYCYTLEGFISTVRYLGYADLLFNAFVPSLLILIFISATLCRLIYNKHLEEQSQIRRKSVIRFTQRRRSLYSAQVPATLEEGLDLLQDRVSVALLLITLLFSLPYHIYRIEDSLKGLTRTLSKEDKLRSFLSSQILLHLKHAQLALNALLILVCHRGIRQRITAKLASECCIVFRTRQQEFPMSRVSFDKISNDDSSVVQIIRHEVQIHNATVV